MFPSIETIEIKITLDGRLSLVVLVVVVSNGILSEVDIESLVVEKAYL